MSSYGLRNHSSWIVNCLFVIGMVGCSGGTGGPCVVSGTVNYPDGSPVGGALVICEKSDVSNGEKKRVVRGNVSNDGKFQLFIDSPNGGIPAGTYRVCVMPPPLTDEEIEMKKAPAISPKFGSFDTSEITFTAKSGKNTVPIVVEPGS